MMPFICANGDLLSMFIILRGVSLSEDNLRTFTAASNTFEVGEIGISATEVRNTQRCWLIELSRPRFNLMTLSSII